MNGDQAQANQGEILVVDDQPVNLILLSWILTAKGYNVRQAANGKIALIAAQTDPPDLILLDIDMPKINGYQVCQRLKTSAHTCEVPVIFLSDLDDESYKMKAFAVGGADYITKPFQDQEVVACIQNQLYRRKHPGKSTEPNVLSRKQNSRASYTVSLYSC